MEVRMNDARGSMATVDRSALHRRAVEAVIWGMPAVNYRLMYDAAAAIGGPGDNRIIYWPRLLDWHNQTLTPNPDVIYLMPFIDTKDAGPVVLEVPPADEGTLNGSVMNYWQVAIEDIGPAGIDAGLGGKCLILPPDFAGEVPDGFIPLRSDTYQGYGLIRSVLQSGSEADIARAVDYAKRIQLYPLAKAENPPPTVWIDASGQLFDAAIPYDVRFFSALNQMVQAEPWLARDRVMINQLSTIGIEQGKPFDPDAETQEILNAAIQDARAWLDAEYEAVFRPYNGGKRWALPAHPELIKAVEAFFELPDAYPVDARGVTYSFAFFSAKQLGHGQFYLMTLVDADGEPLDGAAAYRLNVPAEAPVTQYWSATIYNRETHTLLRRVPWAGRSSQTPGLQANPDGSVDLYFGSQQPDGGESNWIPTNAAERFEVLFRFYGPTPALFDKSWQLPDIERTGTRGG
jgi:hypothetical protein